MKEEKSVSYPFNEAIRAFADNDMVAVWELQVDRNEWYVNEAGARILGGGSGKYTEGIKKREQFIAPESLQQMREVISSCLSGATLKYEQSYRIIRPDGQIRWVKEFGIASELDEGGKPLKISTLMFDISEEKRREEGLQAEKEYREFLTHIAGIGGWEYDIKNNHMNFNDDYQKILGLGSEDMEGDLQAVCDRIVHPDDRNGIMQAMKEHSQNTDTPLYFEMRLRHRNGQYVWLKDTGIVTNWDESGNPSIMTGAVINIDAQRKKQQSLQETTVAMFESNPHVNLLFDDAGKLIDCNPESMRLFCIEEKETLLNCFHECVAEWMPGLKQEGAKAVSVEEALRMTMQKGEHDFEVDLLIEGEIIPCHIFLKKIPYAQQHAVVAYLVDLRKIKEKQDEVEKRNQLLYTVNYVASTLMSAQVDQFEDSLKKAMHRIGKAVDVDRMRIWKNYEMDGELCCKVVKGWTSSDNSFEEQQLKSVTNYADIPYLKSLFLNQEIVNTYTSQLPLSEQEILKEQGIRSLMALPIFYQGALWGFIGFDDCRRERIFADEEEKMLISAGNMVVSAIVRNESMTQLIGAREVALESSYAKTEFLSRMSHEIRTPMNAIIGMTTIAKRTNDRDKLVECLRKIDGSSHQLLGIINDILDMSKIDANKFEINYTEFDFEKMIQNVQNVIQVKMEEKRQKFIYDFDKVYERKMIGDELRLSQVLLNLLSNAVKFTPDCETIILKIRETKISAHKSKLRMEVIDNGIGIAKSRQEKLFQSFEQADGSITRQFGGTGLGLAISQKIIHLMGGEIWVESVEGEGSDFIIEVEVEWGSSRKKSPSKLTLSKGQRVLVIDDAQETLDYFSNILCEFSLLTDTALSGRLAIEMVKEKLAANTPYDIILVDWHMPDMNGGETVKAIYELMGPEVLIIMISVSDWDEIDKEAKSYGIKHFLQKPILPSQLYDALLRFSGLAEEAAREAALAEENINWTGKRLLLVEDIEINREIVIDLLDGTGMEISTANDGLEAVNKYNANPDYFDLILMDVQMPIMDGISATRRIRSMSFESAQKIPIIAMTANAFKEDEVDCLEAGMNAHLTKPIEWDKFIKVISQYL